MARKEYPKKLTVLLDHELETALIAERTRLNRETGLPVSLSSTAVRAIRAGLPTALGVDALNTATAVSLPGPKAAAVVYIEGLQPLVITSENVNDIACLAFPTLPDSEQSTAAARLLEIATPHFGAR